MGRPIIVDDGGSIRIKLTDGDGEMDGLLKRPPGHDITPHPSPYNKALIVWLLEDGTAGSAEINPFQKIIISSNQGLNVEVKKQGVRLRIEVGSNTTPPVEPMIESKNINNKRNYTFLNGGRIVRVNDGSTDIPIPNSAVYAGVIIT